MSRRSSKERRVEWKLSLQAELAARVNLRLLDPLTVRPGYGSRKDLIEFLLETWLSGGIDELVKKRQEMLSHAPTN